MIDYMLDEPEYPLDEVECIEAVEQYLRETEGDTIRTMRKNAERYGERVMRRYVESLAEEVEAYTDAGMALGWEAVCDIIEREIERDV